MNPWYKKYVGKTTFFFAIFLHIILPFTKEECIKLKKKIKRSVKKWNYLHSHNRLPVWNTIQSLNSWLGHTSHCNSYKLQKKVLNSCNFLVSDGMYENIEKEMIELIENEKNKN